MARLPLTIASISAELAPLAKTGETGGLGEVAWALPRALRDRGHRVIPITPLHHIIKKNFPDLERIGEDNVKLYEGLSHKATFYRIELDRISIYLIDSPHFFSKHRSIYTSDSNNERFFFLNRATLSLFRLLKLVPDVVQCHDWHAGLLPYFLHTSKRTFKNVATVFTIHNLVFQFGDDWWTIPPEEQDDGFATPEQLYETGRVKRINFALRGIRHADAVSTVSEHHAQEILTKKFGSNLEIELRKRKNDLFGIVNGVDYRVYNPKTDPGLGVPYDVNTIERKVASKQALQRLCHLPENPGVAVLGMVSRITEQKGFDLILEILDVLMRLKLQLVIMGSGDEKYERAFRATRRRYPEKFSYLTFEKRYETLVYAGSDLFLMPSRFEPCGLGQLISLRYGSIPIVHAVGGLSETVSDFNPRTGEGNGFVFTEYDARLLLATIVRGVENWYRGGETWRKLLKNSMREVYSWNIPAARYVSLFRHAIHEHEKEHRGGGQKTT